MQESDWSAVRERLLADRAHLEQEVYALTQGDRATVPSDPVSDAGGLSTHEADDADGVTDYATNQALIQHTRGLLDQVKHALERLDAGTYGICERCGKPIPTRRLEILPYATLCVQDQDAADREAAQ